MQTLLTWWEYDQLFEHLDSRRDIWIQSDENEFLWLRLEKRWETGEELESEACAVLLTAPTSSDDPYRMYVLQSIPMSWGEAQTDTYIQSLLRHWTPFARRETVASFLRETLQHDAETAELAAIALEALDWGDVVPSDLSDPEHSVLTADSVPPIGPPPPQDPCTIGTWLLVGAAGWLHLALRGGQMRIRLSVRAPSAEGFATPLEGYVRPLNGHVRDTAAALGEWAKVVPIESICLESRPLPLEEGERQP
jgi:hypothetical protein